MRAWFEAAQDGDAEALASLAPHVDIQARDEEGLNAAMYAAAYGHADGLRLLIGWGADLDAKDETNARTAAMWAADQDQEECLGLLLGAGADIQATDNAGRSAEQVAVGGCAEMLRAVREARELGAEVGKASLAEHRPAL